jgi:hypothetical protein
MSQPVTPFPAAVAAALQRFAEAVSIAAGAWIQYGSRRNARLAVESDRAQARMRAGAPQALASLEQGIGRRASGRG